MEKRCALVKLHLRVKTEVLTKHFSHFNISDLNYHNTIWIIKMNASKICILLSKNLYSTVTSAEGNQKRWKILFHNLRYIIIIFKTIFLKFLVKMLNNSLLIWHCMNEINSMSLIFKAGNNSHKLAEWLLPKE